MVIYFPHFWRCSLRSGRRTRSDPLSWIISIRWNPLLLFGYFTVFTCFEKDAFHFTFTCHFALIVSYVCARAFPYRGILFSGRFVPYAGCSVYILTYWWFVTFCILTDIVLYSFVILRCSSWHLLIYRFYFTFLFAGVMCGRHFSGSFVYCGLYLHTFWRYRCYCGFCVFGQSLVLSLNVFAHFLQFYGAFATGITLLTPFPPPPWW